MEEIKRYQCTSLSALLTEAQCRRNKETAEFTGTPGIYACCLECKGLEPEPATPAKKRERKLRTVVETPPADHIPDDGEMVADDCPTLTLRFVLPKDREIYEKLCRLSTDIESDLLALLHVMSERDLLVRE